LKRHRGFITNSSNGPHLLVKKLAACVLSFDQVPFWFSPVWRPAAVLWCPVPATRTQKDEDKPRRSASGMHKASAQISPIDNSQKGWLTLLEAGQERREGSG